MPPLKFQENPHFRMNDTNPAASLTLITTATSISSSGAYWYPGPNFHRKCKIGPPRDRGRILRRLFHHSPGR